MVPARIMALIGATSLVCAASTAGAQNFCDADKKKCVSQRVVSLLKCYRTAESRGEPVDQGCIDRADEKFNGGADPAAGCFEKSETKFPPGSPGECTTYDDTASIQAEIDGFVQDVLDALGNAVASACSAKKTCVGKLVKALLKCHSTADRRGFPVDSACLDKAKAKFDGDGEPCKGCFRKVEDRNPPGSGTECPTFQDTPALSLITRGFVDCIVTRLADPSGAPCVPSAPVCGPVPDCAIFAAQSPDCSYAPVVTDPAYGVCAGPKILVDTTHGNFHNVTPLGEAQPGRYWGFARLLHEDGYDVRDSDVPFASQLPATAAEILVIANAQECGPTGEAVPADDVAALVDWVTNGGSLLLVIDHQPFERVGGLLAALGLERLFVGQTIDPVCSLTCDHCPRRCKTFRRADGSLNGASPLADGPNPPTTAVDEVSTFAGTAFTLSATPPAGATYEPVLVFPPGSVGRSAGQLVDISGFSQGVAIQLGSGRVYVSGEAGGLTAQRTFGMQFTPENERYLRNVIAWLDD